MSRNFPGTAEELDSDLLMVWHALNDWEKIDGEWGTRVRYLKDDLRKRHIDRRRSEAITPPREWIKGDGLWKISGYPLAIRFDRKSFSAWRVYSQNNHGLFIDLVAEFNSPDEAKAFAENRCNDIDRFEEGP